MHRALRPASTAARCLRGFESVPRACGLARRTMCDDADQAMMKPEDIDTRKLYRDCLKLSYHIAAESAKGHAMREMIRQSFKANMSVEEQTEINKLKMRAILGIQNYVIHESTRKAIARRGKK